MAAFPNERDIELRKLERRRRMAEALTQSALAPLGPTEYASGGMAVRRSPLEGIAKVVQAYAGRRAMSDVDEAEKGLIRKNRDDLATAMSEFQTATAGRPALPEIEAPSEDLGGGPGRPELPAMPATAEQRRAAAMTLAGRIGDPSAVAQAVVTDALKTPALKHVDLGDAIGVMDERGNIVARMPKGASPDARLRADTTMQTHRTPSGSALLSDQGADRRHAAPSGNALLSEQGANRRHAIPSGSAALAADTARFTHSTPSASARLGVDPTVQGPLAEARAAGTERGQATAKAQLALPEAAARATQGLELIDQMIGSEDGKIKRHPGFETVIGSTWTPGARFLHGTDAASFDALLEQVKGGAFLQAFESLKGGGAITKEEGDKATQAVTRMQRAQSEKEFMQAAREYQTVLRNGVQRAQQLAGGQQRRVVDW